MAVQKGGEGEALELTVDCSLGSVFVCVWGLGRGVFGMVV